MPLVITAVLLSVLALSAVAAMASLAASGLLDPPCVSRCPGCHHWMINCLHKPGAECFRCRHHAHAHAQVPIQ